MDFNAIRPDGPTIAIEHQATGEQPVYVTPDGIQPAAQAAVEARMDLEACPFCGGKAKIYATTTRTYPNHGKHYCYCEKCLASGQSFSDFENDGSSIFKAVEAWNRRVKHESIPVQEPCRL